MKMPKRVLFVAFVVFAMAFGAVCGFAVADEPGPWAKLERGAINTTTGWMELGVQPYHEIRHSNQPVVGAFLGFGKGILAGLQRTGYGLSDSLSFPLEPHGRPVMEPETLFKSE